ncbi:hypothetical protein [Candidatus Albibeggiatoa sp. nov. NOAA]|uniref:hypothetical protein n=1 Tax=Candidatus Albibeggiatoa sp. nov. NOAA TaxID=3162724 RepID=UPI0032F471C8|nr:hypothetical protein [Thiotrichaceae bacterium]
MYKEMLSIIAIVLTFVAFFPYIRAILRDQIKPHVFSWIIWSLTTYIVFFAQLADGAGVGAWPTGISGLITLYVALLAYQRCSDSSIVLADWFFFILALTALPLWFLTADPFWAVLVLSLTDLLGFIPTLRKAYMSPFDEQLIFFVLMAIRSAVSIAALEHYSATTVLFPAMIVVVCIIFIIMVSMRRAILRKAYT